MYLINYIFLFCLLAFLPLRPAQAQEAPTSRLFGDIRLSSDRVENGLSQTQKQPSFSAIIGHQFANSGRLWFFAGNVKYPNEDAHLNVRPFGSFDFVFSQATKLTFQIEMSKYFGSGDRDSQNLSLSFLAFDYNFKYITYSKFENTNDKATSVRFFYERPAFYTFFYKLDAGYNMLQGAGFNNYFDADVFLFAQPTPLFKAGTSLSYASSPSQFEGRAGFLFAIRLSQSF